MTKESRSSRTTARLGRLAIALGAALGLVVAMVTTSSAFQKPTTISMEIFVDNPPASFEIISPQPRSFIFDAVDLNTPIETQFIADFGESNSYFPTPHITGTQAGWISDFGEGVMVTIDPDAQTITVDSRLPLNINSYIDLTISTDEVSEITLESSKDLTAADDPVIEDDFISFHLAIDPDSFDDREDKDEVIANGQVVFSYTLHGQDTGDDDESNNGGNGENGNEGNNSGNGDDSDDKNGNDGKSKGDDESDPAGVVKTDPLVTG